MSPQALLGGITAAHGRLAGRAGHGRGGARPLRAQQATGQKPAPIAGSRGAPHALCASASAFQAGSPLISGHIGARGNPHRAHAGAARAAAKESDPAEEVENVVIIGSGPAGYTAAIYAGRANLAPFCFEGFTKGGTPGGQLMTTTEVENFPGFPEGITGPDLMDRMRQQAVRWGAECVPEDVEEVDLSVRPFVIKGTERTKRAHAIIVATGATAKRLGIPSEHEFWSRGISACAICDGASPIFKGQELAVVGGGDTAAEEAVYLTKYGKHVNLLVRGDQMTASKAMQDRALASDKVTVNLNTEVVDAYGDSKGRMSGLTVRDTVSGEERKIPAKGLFYGIGHTPNSQVLGDQVELDESGYVKVKPGTAETSVEGVFSAGDLHDIEWRQAITAAGSGCMAAISVERYLVERDLLREVKSEEVPAAAAAKEEEEEAKEEAEGEVVDLSVTKHKGQTALRYLYHEAKKPMAVLYTSPTCGPCRTLKPMLNAVVDEYQDSIYYVEIDIEVDPEIAEAAGVMGTPTFHIFKDKGMVESHTGVKMKREFREMFDKHCGGGDGETVGSEVPAEETENVPQ